MLGLLAEGTVETRSSGTITSSYNSLVHLGCCIKIWLNLPLIAFLFLYHSQQLRFIGLSISQHSLVHDDETYCFVMHRCLIMNRSPIVHRCLIVHLLFPTLFKPIHHYSLVH